MTMTYDWKRCIAVLAVPAIFAMVPTSTSAQGPLGTAVINGSVRIDGQVKTGSVPVGMVSRISTGKDSTLTLQLAKGGEIRIAGQADMAITPGASGPHIQLICGEITVTSTVPATVVSQGGGRVEPELGKATVTRSGKSSTVKKGKSKDFDDADTVTVPTSESVVVVTSKANCHCNC
ncbi:MAG: hypothetical protein IT175_05340 [Acidobacteria bacterium]|nr:hypothetical protein [Acidobacteriota bacterium]